MSKPARKPRGPSRICHDDRHWRRLIAILRGQGLEVHPQEALDCGDCRQSLIQCRCQGS